MEIHKSSFLHISIMQKFARNLKNNKNNKIPVEKQTRFAFSIYGNKIKWNWNQFTWLNAKLNKLIKLALFEYILGSWNREQQQF